MNVCGMCTLFENQKKNAKRFSARLKKRELDAIQKENINVIAFTEKIKDVLLLATIYIPDIDDTGQKNRKKGENILKPKCILDYNKNMGGINIGDSIMTHHPKISENPLNGTRNYSLF